MQPIQPAQPLANRQVDQILQTINNLENKLLIKHPVSGRIELAQPAIIADNISMIAALLQQTVDPITQIELDYRRTKAARFNKFIKDGMKKSPAIEALKFESDLIEMESAVNRVNNFVKLTLTTISTFQSNLRVKTGMANGNF